MKEDSTKLKNEIDMIKDILTFIDASVDSEALNDYIIRYSKQYVPEDILAEREERVHVQEELIKKYNSSLICIRVNYPGVIKNDYVSIGIMKILCDMVIKEFSNHILYKKFNITAEGPIIILVVDEVSMDIKNRTVGIEENHPLGRFVDIDVYDKYNRSLSRKDLGLDSRRCYICENYAHICVRQRQHNEKEIKNFIKNSYKSFL